MHPTSFPGPHGIGDLGKEAYRFIDFLVQSGQSLWQVLPLGPTGYGDSPYASFSSFAGNPLLIDLDQLVRQGDLDSADLEKLPDFPPGRVDFGRVIDWKIPLLEKAARNFLARAGAKRRADFEAFCKQQQTWLNDFALFMALKEHFDSQAREKGVFGARWNNYWNKDIALRRPKAVKRWERNKDKQITVKKVLQYYFFAQWRGLRRYANEHGVRIIGDIPIFVAPDSVDVWANRDLFFLNEHGQPTVVAGVPPDYFSETGQLWGNPLYNWQALTDQDYSWWIERIRFTLQLVDIIRIDHFRGFAGYWEIPAGEENAVGGRWVKAPGLDFFTAVKKSLGRLPILAEDLGVITPDVQALRRRFNFPGMRILQFAFDAQPAAELRLDNPNLPHNYNGNTVVYTGSHDNDTTRGWYEKLKPQVKDYIRRYLARPDEDMVWSLIRLAMASVARVAIIPMQDLLNLGSEARMNRPATLGGNWSWRYRPEALNTWVAVRLREMVDLYGRNALTQKTTKAARKLHKLNKGNHPPA